MVGGGPGAFIGGVHRMAAALDGEWELAAGCFASDPDRSREQGRALGLRARRVYGDYREMAAAEAALGEDRRIDAVAVVTPNHLHHPVATTFLDAGIHVVCDKPMTTTAADAEALCRTVERTGLVFALTHNYTGFPMVKEARDLVRSGRIGPLRKVVAEYAQGWLAGRLEEAGREGEPGHKQAAWRQDPAQAGPSSVLGDIGTHVHNLACHVTGLEVEAVFADLAAHVTGRALDDDCGMLVRFRKPGGTAPTGAASPRGVFFASQVAAGEENGLVLRVYGERGGIVWRQEEPDRLDLLLADAPRRRLSRGGPGLSAAARHATRLPPGHPEGFIEAFANLYRSAGRVIGARIAGRDPDPLDQDVPDHLDGLAGMRFVEAAVASARRERWEPVAPVRPPPSGSHAQ